MKKNIRLGGVLLDAGIITQENLNAALDYQKEHPGTRIGQILLEQGYATERQVLDALASRLELQVINLGQTTVEIPAVERVPQELAQKYQVLAIRQDGASLVVATNDPLDYYALEDLRQITNMELEIMLAEAEPLARSISYYYAEVRARKAASTANLTKPIPDSTSELIVDLSTSVDSDAPIINLVNSLLQRAVATGASDIHIEPFEDSTNVRMRIDGVIVDYVTLQRPLHNPLIARVKILSNLDIAEHRIPQDGHFRAKLEGGQDVNIRVSILPTVFGEKAVLRVLAGTAQIVHANQFGMDEATYARFLPLLDRPNGIIYLTGPTGSGKTTTLYMVLQSLIDRQVNISTVEDPVERNIAHINQTQINVLAGLTFEAGLRALLRQDPDIIMVGETRDGETASISVRAAITGHMVFSTLHTNNAISSILRLVDMGVEPYMVASSVTGLVAQRLMRRVCPHCARREAPTATEAAYLPHDLALVRHPVGCPHCNGTGYSGRIAIHELVTIDKELRRMIVSGATQEEMTDYARKAQGMRSLRESAIALVRDGVTTPAELLKIAYYED